MIKPFEWPFELEWPRLSSKGHTPEEWAAVRVIGHHLQGLAEDAQTFFAAVVMHQRLRTGDFRMDSPQATYGVLSEWMSIAARDSVMTVRRFQERYAIVMRDLRAVASLKDRVDINEMRAAGKELRMSFGNMEPARDAVAHLVDWPKKAGCPPSGIVEWGFFSGDDCFSITVAGATYELPMTFSAAEKLLEITRRVFAAFYRATLDHDRAEMRAEFLASRQRD